MTMDSAKIKASKPNEPLVTELYTADPSAHVFEGKLYIYPSHDIDHDGPTNDNGDQYAMEDYHVFSMDSIEATCVDHGEALHVKDVPWASQQMWAPDAAFRNGLYYLFFPARDKDGIFRIGVATSKSPAGPFRAEENYIEGSFSIDPAVFIDEDGAGDFGDAGEGVVGVGESSVGGSGKAYMYFGGLWGGQLEKWQSGNFDPNGTEPEADQPAYGPQVAELSDDMLSFKSAPKAISIVDEDGSPIVAGDEDRRYFEGPWMHKYNGKYYLSYSTGTTHKLVYAIADNPEGPFVFQGAILTPVIGWTTHHSIVEFGDKWYLFYHDASLSGGVSHKRSMKFTELRYNEDGTIQTIDPYAGK